MIITPHNTPFVLSKDIAYRSTCRDRVGAVIVDKDERVFSWGWNHCGFDGCGMCAERDAVRRANKKRLEGAAIYVCRIKPSGIVGIAFPCDLCLERIRKHKFSIIHFTSRSGQWESLQL